MKRLINILSILAITAGMLAATPARSAKALTRVVSNTDDSGADSLRQALLDANDGDVIDLTGISGTITLLSTLTVDDNLTINGPGEGVLTISGNNAVRVISINTGKTVTIRSLTIANGRVVDNSGAGINNSGDLTLENMVITNNHVVKGSSDFLRGGGIHSNDNAVITIKDTIISSNSAVQNGGGIHVGFDGGVSLTNVVIDNNSLSYSGSSGGGISIREGTTATLDKVSITNNTAINDGGGLYSDESLSMTNSLVAGNTVGSDLVNAGSDGGGLQLGGAGKTFTLRNITVSGNSAINMNDNAYGGGISMTNGTLDLNNVTIASNSAEGQGGGLYVGGSTVNIGNSIIGGNISVNTTSQDCIGSVNSLGYNLIQDPTSCTIDGSIIGVLVSLNPMLKPLANNGGPTQTHALPVNSPATEAGNNATCETTDQRGFKRPQGTTCDLGAYELRKGKMLHRSNGAQDGWVLESGENTNVGGWMDASSPYLALGDDSGRKQYRGILSFGTATLPDTRGHHQGHAEGTQAGHRGWRESGRHVPGVHAGHPQGTLRQCEPATDRLAGYHRQDGGTAHHADQRRLVRL